MNRIETDIAKADIWQRRTDASMRRKQQ